MAIQLSDGRVITPFDPQFSVPSASSVPAVQASSIPTGGGRGMDPIIGSALIGAGSSVASSVTGGKAAKEAARAQAAAQDKALAFAREQEATRQAQYGQAFKMWHASQNALRERYGLPPLPPMEAFPSAGGPAPGGAPMAAPREPVMTARGGRPVTAAEGGPMPGATIGQMIAPRDAEADLGRWNDWQRYELA